LFAAILAGIARLAIPRRWSRDKTLEQIQEWKTWGLREQVCADPWIHAEETLRWSASPPPIAACADLKKKKCQKIATQ
jgi:hypothetical protein